MNLDVELVDLPGVSKEAQMYVLTRIWLSLRECEPGCWAGRHSRGLQGGPDVGADEDSAESQGM